MQPLAKAAMSRELRSLPPKTWAGGVPVTDPASRRATKAGSDE